MILRRAAWVGLALLLALPAAAADPDWAAPFRKYVNARSYLNQIGQQIARMEERLAPQCIQVLAGMKREGLRVVATPEFVPGLPIPQGGQWHEQVRIDRCGDPAWHNVLVTAIKGGTPVMTVLLPGSSKADGRLQVNAAPAAFAIAGARVGDRCIGGVRHIIDTRFVGYLGTSGDRPPEQRLWREIWTVRLCGENVSVRMDFAPDGRGGVTHRADMASAEDLERSND